MNKKHYLLFILILISTLSLKLTAQERVIHGMVTTFDSIPLIEASIEVQSTKQVILTDTLGYFSVGCNIEDKLKVSANGFKLQKVKLDENIRFAAINLKLKSGKISSDLAIGFHIADRDKLNAVARLSNNDVDFSRYQDMHELIRGKFAGVQIVNNEVVIRGIGTTGNVAALIVVDGVARPGSILWTFSPTQIQSIKIIKDGSSAIYGLKGANGVVEITTKR